MLRNTYFLKKKMSKKINIIIILNLNKINSNMYQTILFFFFSSETENHSKLSFPSPPNQLEGTYQNRKVKSQASKMKKQNPYIQ